MVRRLSFIAILLAALAGGLHSQTPAIVSTVYQNARLLLGDGRVIENGAFVVANGRITDIGPNVKAPNGATRVDLSGKTVMPGMINVHVHIGYEGYTSWGAENYTPENVLDHLQREA